MWVACIDPPVPGNSSNLARDWDGEPVQFGNTTSYSCSKDGVWFEENRDWDMWNITCLEGGTWDTPATLPVCLESKASSLLSPLLSAVSCPPPPTKPGAGTWEWGGGREYLDYAEYTCGPYGHFEDSSGGPLETITAVCVWNKTWVPPELPPCHGESSGRLRPYSPPASSCQVVPTPPRSTGLLYTPQENDTLQYITGDLTLDLNTPVLKFIIWIIFLIFMFTKLLNIGNLKDCHPTASFF